MAPPAAVPESLLKKRKRDEDWANKKAAAAADAQKKARENRRTIFKRAEAYTNQYRRQVRERCICISATLRIRRPPRASDRRPSPCPPLHAANALPQREASLAPAAAGPRPPSPEQRDLAMGRINAERADTAHSCMSIDGVYG